MRVGFGYDSHRFEDGRKLVLGGVNFPGEMGLAGHSDADVLIHAIIDAILGAAALGDIGSHFPNSDPAWKDADSASLLGLVIRDIYDAGYAVGNIDATVICERPKMRPMIDRMRSRLAELMSVDVARVSIKGKTNEKLDDIGAGLGIEAHAVVLLAEPCDRNFK